jgi:hypothetical protein
MHIRRIRKNFGMIGAASRKSRAFGDAGVSPAVFRITITMQPRRRDAGATRNGGSPRGISSLVNFEVLVRKAN